MGSNLHPIIQSALAPFAPPRFKETSCSQCGSDTGPGNSGFSSCADHLYMGINGKKTPMHQSYSFRTKTGPYKNAVDVYFDVSSDGDIHDMEVMFHNINIYTVISEDQTEQLEVEAWMFYEADCKEHNDDLKILNWLASQ